MMASSLASLDDNDDFCLDLPDDTDLPSGQDLQLLRLQQEALQSSLHDCWLLAGGAGDDDDDDDDDDAKSTSFERSNSSGSVGDLEADIARLCHFDGGDDVALTPLVVSAGEVQVLVSASKIGEQFTVTLLLDPDTGLPLICELDTAIAKPNCLDDACQAVNSVLADMVSNEQGRMDAVAVLRLFLQLALADGQQAAALNGSQQQNDVLERSAGWTAWQPVAKQQHVVDDNDSEDDDEVIAALLGSKHSGGRRRVQDDIDVVVADDDQDVSRRRRQRNKQQQQQHLKQASRRTGGEVDVIMERVEQQCQLRQRQCRVDYVKPRTADWQRLIVPALREELQRRGMPDFEVQEWTARIAIDVEQRQDLEHAYLLVADALGDRAPPDSVIKFFPLRHRGRHVRSAMEQLQRQRGARRPSLVVAVDDDDRTGDDRHDSDGLPPAAAKRVRSELQFFRTARKKHRKLGIQPQLIGDRLSHWRLLFSDFHPDSKLAVQLAGLAASPPAFLRSGANASGPVLNLEVLFPSDFPRRPPYVRLISPAGLRLQPTASAAASLSPFSSCPSLFASPSAPSSSSSSSTSPPQPALATPSSDSLYGCQDSLTVEEYWCSMTARKWVGPSSSRHGASSSSSSPSSSVSKCSEFFRHLRHVVHKQGSLLSDDQLCLPTEQQFWREYVCQFASDVGRPEVAEGGKILLPHDVMQLLLPSSPLLPALSASTDSNDGGHQPLVFELSDGQRFTYVAALEFTALPGTIVVPDRMRQFFQLPPPVSTTTTTITTTTTTDDDNDSKPRTRRLPDCSPNRPRNKDQPVTPSSGPPLLTVRLVAVPRARRLVLGALTAEWQRVPNQKALLEWVLPKWAALSVRDTVSFEFSGVVYSFRVMHIEPSPVASIVDLDVATEFVDLVATASQSSFSSLPFHQPSSSHSSLPSSQVVSSSHSSLPLSQVVSSSHSSLPFSPVALSSQSLSPVSATSQSSLPLSPRSLSFPVSSYQSLAYPSSPSVVQSPAGQSTGAQCSAQRVASGMTTGNLFNCEHCRQQLPARNRVLHEAQCARHNTFCQDCQVVVRLAELDAHIAACHVDVPCPLGCGYAAVAAAVAAHAKSDCGNRQVVCEFCSLSLTAADQARHQASCGDRTLYCQTCHQYVRRRDRAQHELTCLFADFDLV